MVTTPFADEFNLISRNLKQQQKLLLDVKSKINLMKLVIKPSKCRSLSFHCGKQSVVSFHLKEKESREKVSNSSVIYKPLKFVGSEVTEVNTPSAMSALLEEKLETKL